MYLIKFFLFLYIIELATQNQRALDPLCNVKNCLSCKNRNECSDCKEGYEVFNHRCYSTECSVYGFCQVCDEYDCLKCIKGYKLNYGICDEKIHGFEIKLILGIGIPVITISLIIYLYKTITKRIKLNIESGKILSYKHPKPGNYKIFLPEVGSEIDSSLSKNSMASTFDTNLEKAQTNACVVCEKKKVFTFADCGCALCFEHFKACKENKEVYKCKIHSVNLSKNILIKLDRKSKYKGNAVEKLGLSLCPICKINRGTQSFNCGCEVRICEKCFNDNVYVLKYNQCPGCGKPYVPDRNNIKIRKRSNGGDSSNEIEPTSKEKLNGDSNDSSK